MGILMVKFNYFLVSDGNTNWKTGFKGGSIYPTGSPTLSFIIFSKTKHSGDTRMFRSVLSAEKTTNRKSQTRLNRVQLIGPLDDIFNFFEILKKRTWKDWMKNTVAQKASIKVPSRWRHSSTWGTSTSVSVFERLIEINNTRNQVIFDFFSSYKWRFFFKEEHLRDKTLFEFVCFWFPKGKCDSVRGNNVPEGHPY